MQNKSYKVEIYVTMISEIKKSGGKKMAKKYHVVIIGGGPGGVATALSARNTYPEKEILLIRKEKTALIPCGIPYTLHTLEKVEDDILPDASLEKNKIEVKIDEVIGANGRRLSLKSGEEVEWNKLVLAIGAKPFVPPIPGINENGVYFVKKDINYLKELKERVEKSQRVLIVGGGFIGVEMADELLKKGKEVVIVEILPSLLPLSMDPEFGKMVAEELRERGAEVHIGVSVKKIGKGPSVKEVELENGRTIPTDLVIVATGYRPNLGLAEELGLEINERYGIIVDEYMRTSKKDIFAVGDCVAKRHFLTGKYSKLMLASSAMAQGRLAGSNLSELKVVKGFLGTLGTFSTKIGKSAFASVGLTEREAKSSGIDYVVGTYGTVDRHPGKLPGVSRVFVKLIFARYCHFLLGAQVKGGDSVGELINMFAVMIQRKMTDMEIDTLQIGTHPLLTSSPIVYPVINATVNAIIKWYKK